MYLHLALAVSSIVIFLFSLLYGRTLYRENDGETFSLANHFPFELYKKNNDPIFIGKVLSALPAIIFFINFVLLAVRDFTVSNAAFAFISLLIAFSYVVINIYPLYHLKAHLISALAFITFTSAINIGLAFSEIRIYHIIKEGLYLIPMVINILIFLTTFFLLLNRKIFDLSMNKTEEGTTARPKVFVLALSEWIASFLFLLTQISLIFISFLG